jgi:hypothetical protein
LAWRDEEARAKKAEENAKPDADGAQKNGSAGKAQDPSALSSEQK